MDMKILLIEDNAADAELLGELLEDSDIIGGMQVSQDGEEAMQLLNAIPVDGHCPVDLVLLDLNLPGFSGLEILSLIRSNRDLKMLPVVILSSSAAQEDVQDSYLGGANSYIVKPQDLSGYRKVVTILESYWFDIVSLPSCDSVHKSGS